MSFHIMGTISGSKTTTLNLFKLIPAPINLTSSNVTSKTVDLSWTSTY